MFYLDTQLILSYFFFFFNDTATTEIYTLSLHDALPICRSRPRPAHGARAARADSRRRRSPPGRLQDRKSTRLNSSHLVISYAVFCLKKKKSPLAITDRSRRLRPSIRYRSPTRPATAVSL